MVKTFKASKNDRHKKQASDVHLHIEQMDHHGNGINLSQQPIAVVRGALPGEEVQVEVLHSSKRVVKGVVRRVNVASSKRQTPFCQHFGTCGGCQLQHASNTDGLAMKSEALQSYVRHKLNVASTSADDLFESPITSPNRYRRKVRLAIDARDPNAIKIGFRAQRSQKVVDVNACPILDDRLEMQMLALKQSIVELGVAPKLGHIEMLLCQEGVQAYINSIKQLSSDELMALRTTLDALDIELVGPLASNTESEVDATQARITEPKTLAHLTPKGLLANVGDFVQINSSVNLELLSTTKEWLTLSDTDTVADFFAGSGNFTFAVAPHVNEVKAFEVVDTMVERIADNCEFTQTTNVQASVLDLSDATQLRKFDWASIDKVILDPARAGAETLVRELVAAKTSNIKCIVYVSCNPDTFIRDAQILLSKYTLTSIKVADMFPFTEHLEIIARFTPKMTNNG